MRKRNALKTGHCRKMAAQLLALSLMMCQLTACSFLRSVISGNADNAGHAEISEEDLPEGTSLAGAALPDAEPSVQVSPDTFAGLQVRDAAGAKAFLQDMKDEIGFSDISEFSDAAPDSTSTTNIYRFTQMAGGLPVEGRGIRVLTDQEGQVIDVNGRYLDPAEIDSEVLVSSGEACQAVKAWFASEEGGEAAGGGSASGAVGKAEEIVKILTSPEDDAAGRVGAVLKVLGGGADGAESESDFENDSDAKSEDDSDAGAVRQIVQGCVICFENDKPQAAWKTLAFTGGGSYQCYVSARDGAVLSVTDTDVNESAEGSGEDAGDRPAKFRTEKRDGTYWLEDEKARVRVFDIEGTGEQPKLDFYIRPDFLEGDVFFAVFDENDNWDTEGERGFPILLNNEEDPEHDYRLIVRDEKLAVTDNGTVIHPDVFVEPVYKKGNNHFEVLSDSDNVWENKRAVSVMEHLQEADRYWREVMVRNGWDDRNSSLVFGLNADIGNAATSVNEVVPRGYGPWNSGRIFCAGQLKVNSSYSVAINVIAHEYTHAVIKSYVNLGRDYRYPEASAIHEGLADLFSEFTEQYITKDCDWLADKDTDTKKARNMKEPSASGNPSAYKDKNWNDEYIREAGTDEEQDTNSTFAHDNSTVISHMGYLMATGDLKKSEKTEALGTFLTGRLFYNTFPHLETDTTFAEYATILYMEAVRMYRVEQMSAKEVYCVYRAIEEVGLLPVFELRAEGDPVLEYLNGEELTGFSVEINAIDRIKVGDRYVDVVTRWEDFDQHAELKNEAVRKPGMPKSSSEGSGKKAGGSVFYKLTARRNGAENEDFSCILWSKDGAKADRVATPFLGEETIYYSYLKETYGTEESDLVSAYIMDFDGDGSKDLLTVTKGSVILANTPLGPFGIYKGETPASTLDLNMYQLDEQDNVVRTGTILGAGTVEGHSRGDMAVSIVLQDGKPYICGHSTNEDTTTYGARPYVIYEVIDGGGFQYDYVSGVTWGQYAMGRTDDQDPNQVAGTYGLDVNGTQLSEWGKYGVLLCEAEADNIRSPGTFTATDYTMVKEGIGKGYMAVKGQLSAMQEEMIQDAKTFEERTERAKDTEAVFETFAEEMKAAGAEPVLEEYITDEDAVTGTYTCQNVDIRVKVAADSGELISIGLFADGYPVPASWFTVKDAVLTSSFAGLDQAKIGELLGKYRDNFSVSGFDAGPAKILAGNAGTIVLRIEYQ